MDSTELKAHTQGVKLAIKQKNAGIVQQHVFWFYLQITNAMTNKNVEQVMTIRAHICTLSSWSKRYFGNDQHWHTLTELLYVCETTIKK